MQLVAPSPPLWSSESASHQDSLRGFAEHHFPDIAQDACPDLVGVHKVPPGKSLASCGLLLRTILSKSCGANLYRCRR